MVVNVLNIQGSKVKELNLVDGIFNITPHEQSIYEVVRAQRLAMRQGTHDVKNRGEVSGGGRKPYKQKGTARARQGSIRAGQWVGGGTIFGPTPRKYDVKINKKVRQLALKSALSFHNQHNTLIVLDQLQLKSIKTKDFEKVLENLKLQDKKTLFLDVNMSKEVLLSGRNIPTVILENSTHASVYDLLNCKNLVLTEEAVKYFEEALK